MSYLSSLLCRILKQISFDMYLGLWNCHVFLDAQKVKGIALLCWPPWGWQVLHSRDESKEFVTQRKKHTREGWSLLWKTRTDVNSCPKHGYQWPHKRTNVFKNVHLQRTSGVNKEIGTKLNPVHFLPGCLDYLLLFSKWSVNFSSSWRHHHHHPHREELETGPGSRKQLLIIVLGTAEI